MSRQIDSSIAQTVALVGTRRGREDQQVDLPEMRSLEVLESVNKQMGQDSVPELVNRADNLLMRIDPSKLDGETKVQAWVNTVSSLNVIKNIEFNIRGGVHLTNGVYCQTKKELETLKFLINQDRKEGKASDVKMRLIKAQAKVLQKRFEDIEDRLNDNKQLIADNNDNGKKIQIDLGGQNKGLKGLGGNQDLDDGTLQQEKLNDEITQLNVDIPVKEELVTDIIKERQNHLLKEQPIQDDLQQQQKILNTHLQEKQKIEEYLNELQKIENEEGEDYKAHLEIFNAIQKRKQKDSSGLRQTRNTIKVFKERNGYDNPTHFIFIVDFRTTDQEPNEIDSNVQDPMRHFFQKLSQTLEQQFENDNIDPQQCRFTIIQVKQKNQDGFDFPEFMKGKELINQIAKFQKQPFKQGHVNQADNFNQALERAKALQYTDVAKPPHRNTLVIAYPQIGLTSYDAKNISHTLKLMNLNKKETYIGLTVISDKNKEDVLTSFCGPIAEVVTVESDPRWQFFKDKINVPSQKKESDNDAEIKTKECLDEYNQFCNDLKNLESKFDAEIKQLEKEQNFDEKEFGHKQDSKQIRDKEVRDFKNKLETANQMIEQQTAIVQNRQNKLDQYNQKKTDLLSTKEKLQSDVTNLKNKRQIKKREHQTKQKELMSLAGQGSKQPQETEVDSNVRQTNEANKLNIMYQSHKAMFSGYNQQFKAFKDSCEIGIYEVIQEVLNLDQEQKTPDILDVLSKKFKARTGTDNEGLVNIQLLAEQLISLIFQSKEGKQIDPKFKEALTHITEFMTPDDLFNPNQGPDIDEKVVNKMKSVLEIEFKQVEFQKNKIENLLQDLKGELDGQRNQVKKAIEKVAEAKRDAKKASNAEEWNKETQTRKKEYLKLLTSKQEELTKTKFKNGDPDESIAEEIRNIKTEIQEIREEDADMEDPDNEKFLEFLGMAEEDLTTQKYEESKIRDKIRNTETQLQEIEEEHKKKHVDFMSKSRQLVQPMTIIRNKVLFFLNAHLREKIQQGFDTITELIDRELDHMEGNEGNAYRRVRREDQHMMIQNN